MLFWIFALFASFAAEQVFAFNFTVGNRIVGVNDILAFPDGPVKAACSSVCSDTSARFTACGPTDATCLCRAEVVQSLVTCETCLLHNLIATNKPAPDFRVGSNVLVGAYAANCLAEANVTVAAALKLPASWDGPFTAVLPAGAVVVAVTIGGLLGGSALLLLSNM